MKYFLIFFLFSSTALADQVILDRTNHAGLRVTDILQKEKGEYIFNGKTLGKKLPANIDKIWKDLNRGPSKDLKKKACHSGEMTYIVIAGKKERRHKACTEGKAYAELIKKVDDLRSYAKGNP
ncbi:hypothetical protein [Bdellovibrio reynosensis]|uniref:Uncharacterized protein n=1 Tax=Bdellovibrio reynosensis TaxID=2835041 RepID=A0ABY4C9K5_9BACT|nr:hypothetical protein [Bdellovibrio reynosensis]UOF01548.1 hypothetical protein MNR06_01090 [Bdellovibrio reynosensis]